jgi:hypothetical protein
MDLVDLGSLPLALDNGQHFRALDASTPLRLFPGTVEIHCTEYQ